LNAPIAAKTARNEMTLVSLLSRTAVGKENAVL
jgi:hypothetical protein